MIPRTAAGVGAGVGVGVGAAVNVQVASWSATATALPASSAVWKTTCGQSNVAPLTHAGMSRMVFSASSPLARPARFFGSRPIPTGSKANGERAPKSASRVGRTRLTGTPLTSCLPSVKRMRAGRAASSGRCFEASCIAAT